MHVDGWTEQLSADRVARGNEDLDERRLRQLAAVAARDEEEPDHWRVLVATDDGLYEAMLTGNGALESHLHEWKDVGVIRVAGTGWGGAGGVMTDWTLRSEDPRLTIHAASDSALAPALRDFAHIAELKRCRRAGCSGENDANRPVTPMRLPPSPGHRARGTRRVGVWAQRLREAKAARARVEITPPTVSVSIGAGKGTTERV